jgi:hypothetical protein
VSKSNAQGVAVLQVLHARNGSHDDHVAEEPVCFSG